MSKNTRTILICSGKGGVGKTTTSTASAIHLADCGLKVLLVSSDPAHSTSDSLGFEIGTEPTPIPELSGNTVDEDGIEWAQDASGNWYWREENGQFELYES